MRLPLGEEARQQFTIAFRAAMRRRLDLVF